MTEQCIDHGGLNKRYSTARYQGKVIGKHVKVLIDHKGDKRPMYALHSCDNPRCINPNHLDWGTQSQNLYEAIAAGRRTY